MPIRKSRLSKFEQKKYLLCLQELRAKGCDVEIPSEWLDHSTALDVTVLSDGSTAAVEGRMGGVFYVVHVRLVARQSGVILLDCQLESEWDDDVIMESFGRKTPIYRLGHLQYPAAEVLNDRIEDSLRFRYDGQMVDGVILFSGLKPIPERYRLGMSAPFKLALLDQFGVEREVKSSLFVSREAERKVGEAAPSGGLHSTAEEGSSQQSGR